MSSGQSVERASLLSLGVVVGGQSPKNELVGEALRAIAKRVTQLRKGHPSGLKVNVVFHLPGPIAQPDYEGVHARKLDQKSGELLVHAAVPPDFAFDRVTSYVADVLVKARQEARDYLRKRKANLSTSAVDGLIEEVIDELRRGGKG